MFPNLVELGRVQPHGTVNSIAMDRAATLLVTGGEAKVVELWSVPRATLPSVVGTKQPRCSSSARPASGSSAHARSRSLDVGGSSSDARQAAASACEPTTQAPSSGAVSHGACSWTKATASTGYPAGVVSVTTLKVRKPA